MNQHTPETSQLIAELLEAQTSANAILLTAISQQLDALRLRADIASILAEAPGPS